MNPYYLSQLNDQQRAAVEYLDGPELVIAGAGSGKTRVLTYKIVYLLARGFEPGRILALTFTNKAAREMRERIESLVGSDTARRLWMGTFHSIFSRILRRNAELIGYSANYTIYDQKDSQTLIKSIIKDLGLDEKIYKPATVQNSISSAKNHLLSPGAYMADRELMEADRQSRRGETANIYSIYMKRCRIADAMDFDDLLYYTAVLFRDHQEVLNHYREFFRYILVDEYQDTNFAQNFIMLQLSSGLGNICVVGDDAQSIYSFRGANIGNILGLRNAFSTLATFKLEQNYRSTKNIVNAANSLIAKNKEQIRKTVFSENDRGECIEVQAGYSDYDEAGLVATRIVTRRAVTGDKYSDFAILYRTNAQSRVLEESLRRRSIPYRIYGGLAFYQRKEVKDAISYFRLAVNPNDDEALKRVINVPARGIGATTLGKLGAAAIAGGVSIWAVLGDPARYNVDLNSGTRTKLANFYNLVNRFIEANKAGATAEQLSNKIIEATGLLQMYLSDHTPESISKQENLQELLRGAHDFVEDQVEAGDGEHLGMADFLSEVSLATDQDQENPELADSVTLMTIHAAKGLEFANIFVVGVEDDLIPSQRCCKASEIEEERRLFYVAITRAKNFCMISYARSRFINGTTNTSRPSRFLKDIDPTYLKFSYSSEPQFSRPEPRNLWAAPKPQFTPPTPAPVRESRESQSPAGAVLATELSAGTRIRHSKFGNGTVVSVDHGSAGDSAIVNFDGQGVKKLLLRFARISIIK